MKVALNKCHGGFSVSRAVIEELGFDLDKQHAYAGAYYLKNEDFGIESDNDDIYRADPRLIAAIEKVGVEKASGPCAKIEIEDVILEWSILEYDGKEHVETFSHGTYR